MEQITSLIVKKVLANNKLVEQWFNRLVYQMTDEFYKTQKQPTSQLNIIIPVENNNAYHLVNFKNIGFTDLDFAEMIKLNFTYGVPIFAASFCCIVDLKGVKDRDGSELPDESVFFITLETPLKRERQIYTLEDDINDKKYFKLDEYRSSFLKLPMEINRYNNIIQPSISMN